MFYINNSLNTTERFDTAKFLDFDVDNFDCLTSYMLTNIGFTNEQGSYIVTNEAGRPDLLSYNLYQSTQYWWLLMWYNTILDINDLVTGMVIKYPSKDNMENMYLRASTLQKTI